MVTAYAARIMGIFSNWQICQQAYQLVISYYRSSYSLFLQKTCYQES